MFMKKKRVLFISSCGGHLNELLQLKSMFKKYDYYIITEKTKSTLYLKNEYKNKVSYLIYGTRVHPITYVFKLLFNCFKSLFLYIKTHPDYIITTGTHTAGPMCIIGHLFGSRIIYIETFANVYSKTETGRIIYKFADRFYVQWEKMKELYPDAEYGGWIF